MLFQRAEYFIMNKTGAVSMTAHSPNRSHRFLFEQSLNTGSFLKTALSFQNHRK